MAHTPRHPLCDGSHCQQRCVEHLLLVGALVHLCKVRVRRLEAVRSVRCQCNSRRPNESCHLEPDAATYLSNSHCECMCCDRTWLCLLLRMWRAVGEATLGGVVVVVVGWGWGGWGE